jgi:hypothetical protein
MTLTFLMLFVALLVTSNVAALLKLRHQRRARREDTQNAAAEARAQLERDRSAVEAATREARELASRADGARTNAEFVAHELNFQWQRAQAHVLELYEQAGRKDVPYWANPFYSPWE